MKRGEQTREYIIEEAAGLFNRKGFAGASLSDIMDATGLKKGGIYRHFESKEQLAAEAFDFAIARMAERFTRAVEGRRGAVERLHALVDVYIGVPLDPPVPGGCPILSGAVESDHGNPLLRERVREAMNGLRDLVRQVIVYGVERGELRADADAEREATVFTASMEGGIMLTQLYDDPRHVRAVGAHLKQSLERLRA